MATEMAINKFKKISLDDYFAKLCSNLLAFSEKQALMYYIK
jgi:hypothetical protein